MDHNTLQQLREQMLAAYGVDPHDVQFVFAPYRICPLGAHIDHQLGPVSAMAIDHGVTLAFVPHEEPTVRVRSIDFDGEIRVPYADMSGPRAHDWGNYVRGAVQALQRQYRLQRGFCGLTAGRISEGGLSSSAAVSVAYLLALQHVNQLDVSVKTNITLVQEIENHYLQLRIGILDQSAILLSRQNALTVIDCAEVAHTWIERPSRMPEFDILIVSSGLRQALVGTDYNRRVAECEDAARILLQAAGRATVLPKLGLVNDSEYESHRALLTGAAAKRAAHFFSERDRVRRGVKAWQAGDLATFGQLITQSGASSIHQYECGAPPLITLYEALVQQDGVYGARFSGAGFRGCCLALVDPRHTASVVARVQRDYAADHPQLASDAWTMTCRPADGARVVTRHESDVDPTE